MGVDRRRTLIKKAAKFEESTVNSHFTMVISALVLANTVLMGIQADHPEWSTAWIVTENFFTSAFTIELVLKLYLLRGAYFLDRGNLVDFVIVLVAIADCWVFYFLDTGVDGQAVTLIRICRLLRLVRVVRLIKSFRKLYLVVSGMLDAMEATLWVSGILLITIYVGAIFCVDLLGRGGSAADYPGYTTIEEEIDASEIMQNYNPHLRFGSVARAMMSLFNLALLAEWAEVVTPIMEKQPGLIVFFIAFILTTTLCTMNVIVGMICDSVMQHHREIREAERASKAEMKMTVLKQIQQLVREMDCGKDSLITWEALKESFETEDSKLHALFWNSDLHLPMGFTASELLCMLDHNCDQSLGYEEFVQSLYRLVDGDPFQHRCILQLCLNSLRACVLQSHEQTRQIVKESQRHTEALFNGLRASLQDCGLNVQDALREADDDGQGGHLYEEHPCSKPGGSKPLDPSAGDTGIHGVANYCDAPGRGPYPAPTQELTSLSTTPTSSPKCLQPAAPSAGPQLDHCERDACGFCCVVPIFGHEESPRERVGSGSCSHEVSAPATRGLKPPNVPDRMILATPMVDAMAQGVGQAVHSHGDRDPQRQVAGESLRLLLPGELGADNGVDVPEQCLT